MRSRSFIPSLVVALLACVPMAHATPPNFDHDPMSITVGGQGGMKAKHRHHYSNESHRRLFDTLPPNTTPIEMSLPVFIRTGSDAATKKKIRLRLFDTFEGKSFKQELPAADYTLDGTTPNPGPVKEGVATFKITFHKAALDGGGFNKIYLVATVTQGGTELGGDCFQTVTVFQEQSTRKSVHRRPRR